ncbi:PaaI family thioesterase [Ostreiculturibacter nitratireducens]|uniref:PaaI family thioesterase n=1 Tax=Ostreiculturibacter nitratireducens TaxID=3075226 RepID=UPI0031B5CD0F
MTEPFIATKHEDVATREVLLSQSGYDFMRGMLEGRIAHPAIAGTLGYHLHLVEEGRVIFRGAPAFAHTNPVGAVHGGWYGTLLDSCMACAVMTMVPKGQFYTTLEYRVNITRALPPGTEIDAEGIIQHIGRTTGVARGEIRGVADGKLYATGSTTCLIMDGR